MKILSRTSFFLISLLYYAVIQVNHGNLFGQEVSIYSPDGIELVYVDVPEDEKKISSSFYIGKFEITQTQWRAIMGNNPSNFKNENNPVENVNWNDAQNFLARLNERTGKNYRLPTEAEWVFAARADTIAGFCAGGCRFSGSDDIDEVAWFKGNSGGRTQPVGSKLPNELGIYDMSGNVWEWCEDDKDNNRVIRGGSWNSEARFCSVNYKYSYGPENRSFIIGFRVVLPIVKTTD